MTTPQTPTMNTAEAAKRIGVHRRTLEHWCREGLVAHHDFRLSECTVSEIATQTGEGNR